MASETRKSCGIAFVIAVANRFASHARSNPLIAPHKFVEFKSRNEDRKCVPIFLADEIAIEFSIPLVCHIFSLIVLRPNRVVNVMTNLME